MNKFIKWIKGKLGLCQYKGCYKKAEYEMGIGPNITIGLCKKHTDEILVDSRIVKAEMKDGTEIRFE